jgi:hypothetical protein
MKKIIILLSILITPFILNAQGTRTSYDTIKVTYLKPLKPTLSKIHFTDTIVLKDGTKQVTALTNILKSNWNSAYSLSHNHSNYSALGSIVSNGDGSRYLANDGTYKVVESSGSSTWPTDSSRYSSKTYALTPFDTTTNALSRKIATKKNLVDGLLNISGGSSYSIITMPGDKRLIFSSSNTRIRPYTLDANTSISIDTTGSFSGAKNYLELICPSDEYTLGFQNPFIKYNGISDSLIPVSGRKYYYLCEKGWSDIFYYKLEFYKQFLTALSTPVATVTALDTSSLKVKCARITNNNGYKWLVSSDGINFSTLANTAINVDSTTITGLRQASSKYVKVKAIGNYSSYSDSPYSLVASGQTLFENIYIQWANSVNMTVDNNGNANGNSTTTQNNCGASTPNYLTTNQNGFIFGTAHRISTSASPCMIGFGKNGTPPIASAYYNMPYALTAQPNSVYKIWEGGTIPYTSSVSCLEGDIVKITRETGNTIKYYVNNVLIYTSLTAYTGVLYGWVGIPVNNAFSFLNCQFKLQ